MVRTMESSLFDPYICESVALAHSRSGVKETPLYEIKAFLG